MSTARFRVARASSHPVGPTLLAAAQAGSTGQGQRVFLVVVALLFVVVALARTFPSLLLFVMAKMEIEAYLTYTF